MAGVARQGELDERVAGPRTRGDEDAEQGGTEGEGVARSQSFASAAGGPGGIDGVRGSGHTCTRWARGDMPKNSR